MEKLFRTKHHLSYWILYGLYFYAVNALGNRKMTLLTAVVTVPYLAAVFYTMVGVLNRYFAHKKYFMGTLALLGVYVISGVMIYGLLALSAHVGLLYGNYLVDGYRFDWREFVQTVLVLHGQFGILALLYYNHQGRIAAMQGRLDEAARRLQVEEEKRRYEYTALAAQISPHMMANIFQGLKQRLRRDMPALSAQMDMIYRLMAFYMKADETKGADTILLYDEVGAVKDYLTVQREVVGRPFFVDMRTEGNMLRFSIPPTTLLTLVKNAFKHGDLSDPDRPLSILVHAGQYGYSVEVSNSKHTDRSGMVSHGYGLRNLRRRLEIQYGDDAALVIDDTPDGYRAHIDIHLVHGQ